MLFFSGKLTVSLSPLLSTLSIFLSRAILGGILLGSLLSGADFDAAESIRSPENQVFQFVYQEHNGKLYLWIPENCQRLRGLLILCPTVPEEFLVGHAAIRQACADNDLGIVWSVPSFWYWTPQPQIEALQKLLDGLAKVSGYEEVSTIPWLPMGESAHLNMVKALVDTKPERCIAAITIKNANFPQNRDVPVLLTEGTAQEWGQPGSDIRKTWKDVQGSYSYLTDLRRKSKWPMSELIEAGTGHFQCSERMACYFARYIDLAAKARLSDDGSPQLKPVDLTQGYLAPLPIPGNEDKPVVPYNEAKDKGAPWYFDESSAEEAQAIARVDWTAQTQLPMVVNVANCTINPWQKNGVTTADVSTSSEFALDSVLLDTLPAGFVGAGEPLATTRVKPTLEWLCGPFIPLGEGRFRIALDRTWSGSGIPCVLVRANSQSGIRYSNQPILLNFLENKEGVKQTITFAKIADVPVGTRSVTLSASSDANLPVSYFVDSGPAIIRDGKLLFTPIPPRTLLPLAVTVAAWQWGSNTDPKVQTAEIVRQTFHIVHR